MHYENLKHYILYQAKSKYGVLEYFSYFSNFKTLATAKCGLKIFIFPAVGFKNVYQALNNYSVKLIIVILSPSAATGDGGMLLIFQPIN